MNHRMMSQKRARRLAAALLLAALSASLMPYPLNQIGIWSGSAYFLVQAWLWFRERPGAYDLNRLRDLHEREANRDDSEESDVKSLKTAGALLYCHRCSLSVPATHAICPQCGGFLGR